MSTRNPSKGAGVDDRDLRRLAPVRLSRDPSVQRPCNSDYDEYVGQQAAKHADEPAKNRSLSAHDSANSSTPKNLWRNLCPARKAIGNTSLQKCCDLPACFRRRGDQRRYCEFHDQRSMMQGSLQGFPLLTPNPVSVAPQLLNTSAAPLMAEIMSRHALIMRALTRRESDDEAR